MQEVWKPVVGYEGLYEVSNFGRIKSLRYGKKKELKPFIDSRGYHQYTLYSDRKRKFWVHQLVAISFLGHNPIDRTIIVDHIDNDKSNNSVFNLCITTQRVNTSKDRKNKSSNYTGVHSVGNKWRASFNHKGTTIYLGLFESELEAHKAYINAITIL